MFERFCFISKDAWLAVADKFPNPAYYGGAVVVNYDSPSQSAAMMQLVRDSSFELVHHSETNAKMIIDAIESGIDKLYNCNADVAREVAVHFNRNEL